MNWSTVQKVNWLTCSAHAMNQPYDEAVSGPDADKWITARGEEYWALVNNGAWEHGSSH